MKKIEFEKGRAIVLLLDDIAFGGDAVGRKNGMVFFVPGGIPGEEVEIEITGIRKNYARGEITQILIPSPHRIEPPCPVHGICGGCGLQHLTYEYQLAVKRKMVKDCIRRIGGLENVEVLPVIAAGETRSYRGKVQAPFGAGKEPFLGLYARGTHRVVKLEDCPVQPDVNNRVLSGVTKLVKEFGWPVYNENDPRRDKGALRYLLCRTSRKSGRAQVTLVSAKRKLKGQYEFAKKLGRAVPEISGIWLNYNPRRDNVVLGEEYHLLAGDEFLEETLGGIDFLLSPGSFFQVNPAQAEVLVSLILSGAALSGTERVLDIYCGAGAFSLPFAEHAAEVTGIENSLFAVEDAERNARSNKIENAQFINGKAEKILRDLPKKYYDLVILDPPRKGCDKRVLKAIAKDGIPEIIYVSCNPPTMGRDLKILSRMGYNVKKVQPVDMFPQTPHVECVVFLEHSRA